MDRDAEKLCAECYGCQLVTPTGETHSYALATMGRFSSGYIGSTSVRRESVSPGGLSQQVDRGGRCQGNHKQDNYSAPGCSVCEIWNTQEFAD